MRIQIKVYIKAEKDQDCNGIKADFCSFSDSFENASDDLDMLNEAVEEKLLGIKEDSGDFTGATLEDR